MKPVRIVGVRVDNTGFDEAVELATSYLRGDRLRMIVTADASTVVIAQRDPEFREIVNSADLVTADSTGILWAAKKLGHPFEERVAGIDLSWKLCDVCAREGHRVFLLGAAPGVAERAAENLARRHPGLLIAGTRHGFFDSDGEVVDAVNASGADMLLVALGIPKQEKWIDRNRSRLNVRLAIGVGGSFDVFAGNVRRAPSWMRAHGLEWVHRVLMDPRKIRKVARIPRFMWLVTRHGSGASSG